MGQFVVGIFTGIVMCMVARKYSIDYSLKKDKSVDPPKYLVFFRAKDVDVMTAAFKEYTGVALKKSRKVSIRKRLQKAI